MPGIDSVRVGGADVRLAAVRRASAFMSGSMLFVK
jgi:hypothetical protein